MTVNSPQGKFHGAQADINVWKPHVQTRREFSLAQIWVMGGTYPSRDTIEAGWQVFVCFYNYIFIHSRTYIFIFLFFFAKR